jgi:hypothetical protein
VKAPNDTAGALDPRTLYVREVLRLYRATPTVLGHVRQADRAFADALFDRAVPLFAVERALLVGAARRILNNAYEAPPPPIRSLHYFATIIDEMIDRPLGLRDVDEIRDRLRSALCR